MEKLAIIIPTYNESANISDLISRINSLLPHSSIIVVDDNSPDGTSKIVAKLQTYYPNLFLISRSGKTGRGSAVLDGFRLAIEKTKANSFIEMDADFSHDPEELPTIVSLSKPGTLILASRYLPESKILNWPRRRIISSQIANLLIRIVLGLPSSDNTNGYRCYNIKEVKLLLDHHFISQGYILLSETEKFLAIKGVKITEIPSVFINRKKGKSKASFSEFFYSFYLLLNIRLHLFLGN